MAISAATPKIQQIRKTKNSGLGTRQKLYQFGQPLTKKFGQTGSQVPPPQQLRIVKRYMEGMSIRRIAEEEDRARQTVTKIVRAPEVQSYIEKLREEVVGLGEEMVKSLRFALKNEIDGHLAHEMLKDIGVIPLQGQVLLNSQSLWTEEQQQRLTQEWTRRLNMMAIEKSLVYGTTLPPELERMKKTLQLEKQCS